MRSSERAKDQTMRKQLQELSREIQHEESQNIDIILNEATGAHEKALNEKESRRPERKHNKASKKRSVSRKPPCPISVTPKIEEEAIFP